MEAEAAEEKFGNLEAEAEAIEKKNFCFLSGSGSYEKFCNQMEAEAEAMKFFFHKMEAEAEARSKFTASKTLIKTSKSPI